MRLLSALLLLSVISLASCYRKHDSDPHPRNAYNYIPDTNRYSVPMIYANVNGYKYSFYPYSNIKSSEGNYEHGVASGYWKLYYSDGKLLREGNYSNGKLSGYWKFYYPNGLKKEEGNYQNNIKSGNWIYYYPSGIISSQGNYSNGVKEGEWSFYNEDGSLNYKTSY